MIDPMVEIDTAVLVITPESRLDVFTKEGGIQPFLDKMETQIKAFKPDVSTKAGRDEIRSFAVEVTKAKTFLEKIGDELAKEVKNIPKLVDASRKRWTDTMTRWRDEVRQPLTDFEDAEKERIAKHAAAIAAFSDLALPGDHLTLADLQNHQAAVRDFDPSGVEEFGEEYARARAAATKGLQAAIAKREQYERDQAELAVLRARQAEQDAKDRDARIAAEAAEKVRAEEAAKFERQQSAERLAAQQERDAVEKRARDAEAAQVELRRQHEAAEQQRKDALARDAAEQEKRESNKRHCASVNRAAVKALVDGGVNEDIAKIVVTMIAKGQVPAIKIAY